MEKNLKQNHYKRLRALIYSMPKSLMSLYQDYLNFSVERTGPYQRVHSLAFDYTYKKKFFKIYSLIFYIMLKALSLRHLQRLILPHMTKEVIEG